MTNSLLEAYDKLSVSVSAISGFSDMIGEHPGISSDSANRLGCLMMILVRNLEEATNDIGNHVEKGKS